MRYLWTTSVKTAWRAIVGVIGLSVILIGVIMLVTPGPAIIVIPLGVGILATEFVWAGRLLRNVRDGARSIMSARRNPEARPEARDPEKKTPDSAKSRGKERVTATVR